MSETMEAFTERCRRNAWGTYLGDGRIVCGALGRYSIVVDANDVGLTPNLLCDGFWEPNISLVLQRYLAPGMTAVDIGANVGYFSLLMASKVGPTGKVVSVEANPELAALVQASIVMNHMTNMIRLHNVAVAEKEGFVEFCIFPERNLNSCILMPEWREQVDPASIRRVPAAPLDRLLSDQQSVDFIKIDVEGAEHLVWQGLQATLQRNADIIIVLEYNSARHEHATGLVKMIEDCGFPLRYIDADGHVQDADRAALLDASTLTDWMLFLKRGDLAGDHVHN